MPAQLLLAQPHRRLSLSLNWWNSGFILSDREESLSPWGITPADFLFFWQMKKPLHLLVLGNSCSHTYLTVCVWEHSNQHPCGKWLKWDAKIGGTPKAEICLAHSLWFELSAWKIELIVPLAHCPLPSLGHRQNQGLVLYPACHWVQDLQESPWKAAHQKEWRQKKACPDEINLR